MYNIVTTLIEKMDLSKSESCTLERKTQELLRIYMNKNTSSLNNPFTFSQVFIDIAAAILKIHIKKDNLSKQSGLEKSQYKKLHACVLAQLNIFNPSLIIESADINSVAVSIGYEEIIKPAKFVYESYLSSNLNNTVDSNYNINTKTAQILAIYAVSLHFNFNRDEKKFANLANLKVKHFREILKIFTGTVEKGESVYDAYKKLTLRDTIIFADLSWNKVTQSTILNCFKHLYNNQNGHVNYEKIPYYKCYIKSLNIHDPITEEFINIEYTENDEIMSECSTLNIDSDFCDINNKKLGLDSEKNFVFNNASSSPEYEIYSHWETRILKKAYRNL
ncbi:hypothetical protein A3Q56_06252 [Intoshia linei]|uniref:Uncharacterized protein n=1 Tax=Intoshia linei TaxID=1819745 RepID=A0A177AVI6_9BILA|nr:hypothetical protein A3Q56_06252 [Intoshia linei]